MEPGQDPLIIPPQNPSIALSKPVEQKQSRLLVWFFVLLVLILVAAGVCFYKFSSYFSVVPAGTSAQISTSTVNTITENTPDEHLVTHTIATISPGRNTQFGEYMQEIYVFDGFGEHVMYLVHDLTSSTTADLFEDNTNIGQFFQMLYLDKSLDGSRIDYAGLKVIGTRNNLPEVEFDINGIKQNYSDILTDSSINFTNDGSNYAYAVPISNQILATVYDGNTLYTGNLAHDYIGGKVQSGFTAYSPIFSPDGSKLAMVYQASDGIKEKVVIIDVKTGSVHEDPDIERVTNAVFSPDGSHHAYLAWVNSQQTLVIDGTIQIPLASGYVMGTQPHFSMDGTKIMYSVGNSYAVQNQVMKAVDLAGKTIPYVQTDFMTETQIADNNALQNPGIDDVTRGVKVFDGSGKNWAQQTFDSATAENSQQNAFYVEVNGMKTKDFEYVSHPQFDSTGQYVMFGAREGDILEWNVYKISSTTLMQVGQ